MTPSCDVLGGMLFLVRRGGEGRRTWMARRFARRIGAIRGAIRKEGVQFGNAETIRENQAIRANLRIDFRESDLGCEKSAQRFLA